MTSRHTDFAMSHDEYSYLFKLLLFCDAGCGKTSVSLRLCEDKFTPTHISTIGVDFKIRTLLVDDQLVKLQIWDTAGQERFRSITSAYYRGAHAILIMHNGYDPDSVNSIPKWMQDIDNFADNTVTRFILATKCDLEQDVAGFNRGLAVAGSYGLPFAACSAKTGSNVQEVVASGLEGSV